MTIGAIALVLLTGPLMGNALAAPPDVNAAITNAQTAADTGFVLIAAAMVLLMTPGLAFFYGGFVRSRNVLNTLMMSFVAIAIVGISWILWGYSLAFAPNVSAIGHAIGSLDWAFIDPGKVKLDTSGYLPHFPYEDALKVADPKYSDMTSYAPTIPHQAFMIYQAMFAIITPALISGAIAERMNFTAYSLFVLLWSTFIYSPLAHMVWAKGGFLGINGGLGALDFAGGTVVHISSGVSALVAAIVLGSRKTYPDRLSPPHNVPFILLGAGLLWFGWFGFNAGSALASGGLATSAFVATNTGAAAAALMWLILEKVLRGKPTAVGIATGAVAGLVGITPAAGFVTPVGAILVGAITAFACFYAVSFKHKLHLDDALDTFPVHGVGGTVGAILTGIFATKAVNSAGADGLLFGNPKQLLIQIEAVLVSYIIAAVGTWIILKILDATVGLRINEEAELQGMDINEHGEEGYNEEYGERISSFSSK
ncbi:MAG: ammonium transporter [Stigonema ocellatum SAG 48.90 = DSM 106950]|nr:ammonium transporter [Stigonema ocellatum SAG 48.90 = DSM 106950]